MSKKKKKKSAPMPAQSAGLLRFFEEETEGVKVKPELFMILVVAFIIASVLAYLQSMGALPF
ncbi:MAG: preprotein translocase subunit Sec61beta [Thermoproteota archaeon]|nr:preprotein translocase subunit Sec61beta [Thermoproteota archaeon]